MNEVVVIGAGVIGLTCGIALREAGFPVTVLARAFSPHTTSDVAAAIWYPYAAYPPERVLAWAEASYRRLQTLAADPATGVRMVWLRQLFAGDTPPDWLRDGPYPTRRLPARALPPGYDEGYELLVPLMETPLYMPYLRRQLEALGAELRQAEVHDLAEILTPGRIVVNATGLAARRLTGDSSLHPIRGQIVRVEAVADLPWLIDDTDPVMPLYILPRRHDCILGGTAEVGDEDETPRPETTAIILERCTRLAPALAQARVLQVRVGLRPGRPSVRLETEPTPVRDCLVIHNYGHGGAGFTLSWGCAEEVVGMVTGSS